MIVMGKFTRHIWVKSNFDLQVAKSAFQTKKDPMDACVFYLAMKKKNVLWGLFRYYLKYQTGQNKLSPMSVFLHSCCRCCFLENIENCC